MQAIIGRQDHDDEGAFEKDTYRLLGAQIVGFEGVDKRIDVLATAIRAGMSRISAYRAGACLCAALFLRQGSGKHGRIYGGKYRRRKFETVFSGGYE